MEITSPNSLWKDYDVAALPLNISSLSEKKIDGATVKELYFDGYTTVDGRARVYINIHENPNAKGVILYLPDKTGGANDPIIKTMLEYGYTVAMLDYMGYSYTHPRFTLYPRSLGGCNCHGQNSFAASEDAKSGNWYIWTCISRRAIRLLKELYGKNIFALGMGLGGSTVYKLSAFNDGLTACATLLNIVPQVTGSGNSIINYHASLDNYAYAPISKIPMFIAVSSNDEDGSLDEMSELAKETESLKVFRIIERAFSGGIKAAYNDVDGFFTSCTNNSVISVIPKITASNSEGSLYFNILVDGNENVKLTKPKLFVSFCIEDVSFRNWMNIPLISLGDTSMAHINVCQDSKPISAFVNFEDENGCVHSSPVFTLIPKSLGIKSRAGVSHRKIYDGSMGEDGWTSRNGGETKLVKGPYDIDGITNDLNSLVTFKPGDPLFKVPADTLLQIMLCGEPQSLCVTVSDKTNSYSCTVDIKSQEDWHKFSLSHFNFKGANGPLTDWSQILMLEFCSDKQFIIGSVLWI